MTANSAIISIIAIAVLITNCSAKTNIQDHTKGVIPEIKKNCALCHSSTDMNKGSVLLKKPVQELCIECHRDRKTPNEHKVDIVPAMETGKLPLSEGKMTCVTCHNPHQNPYGSMLRMPAPELCIACHGN